MEGAKNTFIGYNIETIQNICGKIVSRMFKCSICSILFDVAKIIL